MFRLDRKVAIITGGGSGIGRAIAKVFAGQGASVFVLDMDQEAGNSVVKEILQEKGMAEFRKCDVSDHLLATGVVENIFAQGGSIDILVNNAGIAHIGTAESTSEADFERLIRVNIKGVYNCIKAAIPHMKKNGGTILNMASAAATVGIPERFGYSMTKGAVLSMTLSVAKDYVNQNIRCNCISPGRVHTPFVDGFIAKNYPGREKEMFEKLSKTQPIGRMAQPEEIAYLALYLCSEEAAFVTGCDYPIDGGFIRLNN
jgi:2-keto-3-deoxy-L-fuconate dehydrogenase